MGKIKNPKNIRTSVANLEPAIAKVVEDLDESAKHDILFSEIRANR